MRTLMLSSVAVATALLSGSPAAVAQERAFCFRDAGGTLQCNYDTMVLCEQGIAGRSGGCIANPRLGTTGGPPPMGRERGSSDPPAAAPAPPPGAPSTEQMPRR
jgi:Protein of unknown function (DUF3551)